MNAIRIAVISCLILFFAVPSSSSEEQYSRSCKDNPMLSGPCFTARGRMGLYNGTPSIRIWPLGTKRIAWDRGRPVSN